MRFVPNIPLLAIALLVVTPATTLMVYSQGGMRSAAIATILLLVALALFDIILSIQKLGPLKVSTPDLVRCTKGRSFDLPISFENRGPTYPRLRFGIAMSQSFRGDDGLLGELRLLKPDTNRTIPFSITALQRGQFFINELQVEAPSSLSLWLLRRKYPLSTEVRVYPDLRLERKRLSAMFLMRGNQGAHAVRQVGKGREFEQLREYQNGDDYIDIDWKATARRQIPVTRTYQIERTQEVYVIVDHSRLSGREIRIPIEEGMDEAAAFSEQGSGGEYLVSTQLERFLHCSLVLASVAESQGDLFGFISFADQVDRFIRGRNGKEHYNVVRDALYTLEPRSVAPDFEQLMIALRQRLTRRALLVFLVDLSDPLTAEQFLESLPLISRQHLVLVNMVRPDKAHPLFSGKAQPNSISDVYNCMGGHFQWQELQETAKVLKNQGVELSAPEHEELCAEAVSQYLNVKKRQLI